MGVIGLVGSALSKYVGTVVALSIIAFNAMTWAGIGNVTSFNSFLADPFNMMLLAPFAFGMLFAFWGRAIPLDGRLALVALVVAGWTPGEGRTLPPLSHAEFTKAWTTWIKTGAFAPKP